MTASQESWNFPNSVYGHRSSVSFATFSTKLHAKSATVPKREAITLPEFLPKFARTSSSSPSELTAALCNHRRPLLFGDILGLGCACVPYLNAPVFLAWRVEARLAIDCGCAKSNCSMERPRTRPKDLGCWGAIESICTSEQ